MDPKKSYEHSFGVSACRRSQLPRCAHDTENGGTSLMPVLKTMNTGQLGKRPLSLSLGLWTEVVYKDKHTEKKWLSWSGCIRQSWKTWSRTTLAVPLPEGSYARCTNSTLLLDLLTVWMIAWWESREMRGQSRRGIRRGYKFNLCVLEERTSVGCRSGRL